MKATRLLLAALALALVTGCTSSITGPDASAEQTGVQRGMIGSGMG